MILQKKNPRITHTFSEYCLKQASRPTPSVRIFIENFQTLCYTQIRGYKPISFLGHFYKFTSLVLLRSLKFYRMGLANPIKLEAFPRVCRESSSESALNVPILSIQDNNRNKEKFRQKHDRLTSH